MPHVSVLLQEVLDVFQSRRLSVFVDGTLGAGGHAEAILQEHPEIERYYGLDQDPSALKIAEERLAPWGDRVRLVHANFSQLDELDIPAADGILLDLGVSSMQLDRMERGFSFREDGPLDMRMNPNQELTAAEIVNFWPEDKLGKIFRDYGEEKKWRACARAITQARAKRALSTTKQLVEIIYPLLAKQAKKGIHPATRVFQALRIAVNRELEVLEQVVPEAISLLKPQGRLAVISFHSLEDRIVKNIFRESASDKVSTTGIGGVFLEKEPLVRVMTRKPITPGEDEIEQNPRSRSAKLRVVEKL